MYCRVGKVIIQGSKKCTHRESVKGEKNGEKQKLGTNLDDIFSIIGQLKIKKQKYKLKQKTKVKHETN
jgi:hypothetical protein